MLKVGRKGMELHLQTLPLYGSVNTVTILFFLGISIHFDVLPVDYGFSATVEVVKFSLQGKEE